MAGCLARGLCRAGIEVVVVDPFLDGPELMQLIDAAHHGVRVVPFPLPFGYRRYFSQPLHRKISLGLLVPHIVFRLSRLINQIAPSVVVYNLPKSAALALPAALLCRRPTLFYCHGVQFQSDISRLYRLLLRYSSHVIAVSRGTMDQVAATGVRREKISVVYNGVDQAGVAGGVKGRVRRELGLSEQEFVFCYVGNLIRRKGADVLARAFIKFIRDHRIHAHLLIAGADVGQENGQYVAAFKQDVADAGIRHLVHFLGFRHDVPDLLASADMFVMPSRMESFGLSIVEAMAAALPVIATATGSIPEVVEDGISGVLVPSDDAETLAAAMYRLYTDGDLRSRLGRNAVRRAKLFTPDQQIDGFMKAVTSLEA